MSTLIINVIAKALCSVELSRELHIKYLFDGLGDLPSGFVSLDANLPWLCYWILQSLDSLGAPISDDLANSVLRTLNNCQHPEGGYGGGKFQEAHLATTFAAIAALAVIGTEEAYESIDMKGLASYLTAMKQPDGSFSVHEGGEADCRGSYCALATATLTGLLPVIKDDNCARFIASCQTYEGGLGAVPFAEAHAGYTYCGFAALSILEATSMVDIDSLISFAVNSQCPLSGGFRGRTNKLVDGCYSFWGGALFPLIRRARPTLASFNSAGLQKFILTCCQDSERGGLKDKPGKNVDYYHTCYCLAGLNVAQNEPGASISGQAKNRLRPIDPVFNLLPAKIVRIQDYFMRNSK